MTLLNRLKHWDDTAAWRLFVDQYQTLLDSWSRQKLRNSADAEEVNQQVVWEVARRLPGFHYDRSRSFRGWLRTLHHSRLLDFLKIQRRRRLREAEMVRARRPPDSATAFRLRSSSTTSDLAGRSSHPAVIETILSSVQARVSPKTWSIFQDIAINGQTISETATRNNMQYSATFAAYSRTCQMLRNEASIHGVTDERISE